MNILSRKVLALLIFLLIAPVMVSAAQAGELPSRTGAVMKGVQADGACAIVGMSAEQCQLTALQRARASAIEQAAGVSVTSGTLVTNFTVAADFIKTYARGFIVAEKVAWLPLGQYQKDTATAPIPEYRVKITADVYVPEKKVKPLGLQARLNSNVFREGEKARVTVRTTRDAGLAVFNIMADDRVALLFPHPQETNNRLAAGKEFIFPAADSKVEIVMQPLSGHQKDAEALLVIAWEKGQDIRVMDMFPAGAPVAFSEFFRTLADIADRCEETILPYEVMAAP